VTDHATDMERRANGAPSCAPRASDVEILASVDPDGTLAKDMFAVWYDANAGGEESCINVLKLLAARGVLKHPDEPKLADVLERVKRATCLAYGLATMESADEIFNRGAETMRATILAALKPMQPCGREAHDEGSAATEVPTSQTTLVATLVNRCDNCRVPIMPGTGRDWVHVNGKQQCDRNTA
jgi:hypothetical protein